MPVMLVTRLSGLIGSEVVDSCCRCDWRAHGSDSTTLISNVLSTSLSSPLARTRYTTSAAVATIALRCLGAFYRISALSGRRLRYDYFDQHREGNHICDISDLSKRRTDYPEWDISKNIDQIFDEILQDYRASAA